MPTDVLAVACCSGPSPENCCVFGSYGSVALPAYSGAGEVRLLRVNQPSVPSKITRTHIV
jgi:hypothetical protein